LQSPPGALAECLAQRRAAYPWQRRRYLDRAGRLASGGQLQHRCGWLTVLQDRAKPTGKTIRPLVVQSWPVGVAALPGIGIGFGTNLGDAYSYGDTSAGATRLRRVGVTLELRGTGHAQPSLACPEVNALDGHNAVRSGDASVLDGSYRRSRRAGTVSRVRASTPLAMTWRTLPATPRTCASPPPTSPACGPERSIASPASRSTARSPSMRQPCSAPAGSPWAATVPTSRG
jgi:hypothetical protein